MQMKLIITRKVVHLASFWKWGFLELESGLLAKNEPKQNFEYTLYKENDWANLHYSNPVLVTERNQEHRNVLVAN